MKVRYSLAYCCAVAIVAVGCGSTSPTGPPTTTSVPAGPAPTSSDPSMSISVDSPTGIDTLFLSSMDATGVLTLSDHLTPPNPATTTVNYTNHLITGTHGLAFVPYRPGSSEASISFSGGGLAGNIGGVQPDSIVVVNVLRESTRLHITVNRCGVSIPSDVGEIDLTFSIVRAAAAEVC